LTDVSFSGELILLALASFNAVCGGFALGFDKFSFVEFKPPFGGSPFASSPFGVRPFSKSAFGSSAFGASPFGESPFGKAILLGNSPFGGSPFGSTLFGRAILGGTPFRNSRSGNPAFGRSPFGICVKLTFGGAATGVTAVDLGTTTFGKVALGTLTVGFGTLMVTFGFGTFIVGLGMFGFGMLMIGLGISTPQTDEAILVVRTSRAGKPMAKRDKMRMALSQKNVKLEAKQTN
jgi:hypothetical protein